MNNTRKVKGLKGILASGLMGAAVGLASLLPATRAEAENVPINSSMSYTSIQDAIDNSNDNDTIIWDSGSYDKFATTNDFWSLKLTREYIFNDVVINGVNADHEYIFKIVEGGNINISGNLTLRESKNGFLVGTAQYDNINITGVTFNVSQYGLSLENILIKYL